MLEYKIQSNMNLKVTLPKAMAYESIVRRVQYIYLLDQL